MILIRPQSGVERQLRRLERRAHHALVDDVVGGEAQALVGVLLHAAHDQLLVEGAAVDADADRLALIAGDLADGRELLVAPLAGADVARIDPVLVERGGAGRIAGEQEMAVVVEVADERCVDAGVVHALADLGHRRGRLRDVHRDAHHLGAGLRERDALRGGARGIGRIGAGHRLHDDRRAAADLHRAGAAADADADGTMHANHGHGNTIAPAKGRRRDQRPSAPIYLPSAKTSRPMKCSMIASVSGGGSTNARPET